MLFLPFHVIKTPCNPITHPVRPPKPNIPNTISGALQDSKHLDTPIEEYSASPADKTVERTNEIATSPISSATTSPHTHSEFDTDNQAWKEAFHFADHITYPLRLQIARGYRDQLDDGATVEMRELEYKVWECGTVRSEGDHYWDGKRGDDALGAGCKPGWKGGWSEGTARGGRWGFLYLALAGIVCYSFGGLSGVFYWLVLEAFN